MDSTKASANQPRVSTASLTKSNAAPSVQYRITGIKNPAKRTAARKPTRG